MEVLTFLVLLGALSQCLGIQYTITTNTKSSPRSAQSQKNVQDLPELKYPQGVEPENREEQQQYYLCTEETKTIQKGHSVPGSTIWSGPSSHGAPWEGAGAAHSNYKKALTEEEIQMLRDKSCDPNAPMAKCPCYDVCDSPPVAGGKDPYTYDDPWQTYSRPYDDFTGISFYNLKLARYTWNLALRNAARQANIPMEKAGMHFATMLFRTEEPSTRANLCRLLQKHMPFTVVKFATESLDALFSNDSIRFLRIADDLGHFHAKTAATRFERLKWYHLLWFHRSFMATIQYFLGDQLNPEMHAAIEQVSLTSNILHAHSMMLYNIGCKSRVGLEDYIKDQPRPADQPIGGGH